MKSLLLQAFPRTATTLLSIRSRRLNQKVWSQTGLVELERRVADGLDFQVASSPFQGLRLPPTCLPEHVAPFLLGTYEQELHPALEAALATSPTQLIDVGAKIGYYAIGCALRCPSTPAFAFDTDPWAQKIVRQAAHLNKLSHVTALGYCSSSWLGSEDRSGALIISDCEGFEEHLFPASLDRALSHATLIVETHDHVSPGISETLARRFATTHHVQQVPSRGRTLQDWPAEIPALFDLSLEQKLSLMSELRMPQTWLVMTPRDI